MKVAATSTSPDMKTVFHDKKIESKLWRERNFIEQIEAGPNHDKNEPTFQNLLLLLKY